jgi:sugar phosphate isomerase/epimerase
MFKLAVFTDEISRDLERACDICREYGVEGVELRGVWDAACHELSDAQVREARRIIEDHGLAVCSVASPFGKCDLNDPAQVADHMDILRRASDVGLALGCRLVRGFAFWNREQVPSWEKPWDAMRDAYRPVPAILADKGTILGLENEAACYVGAANDTRRFLDMLDCDAVKAVWDPANHVHDLEGRDIAPYPDGYNIIKEDIVHVHMKDAAPGADGSCRNVFLGEGIVDWQGQLEALRNDGYDGFVSLETHVDADRLSPELRARYGAHLTGEGREPASKVSLAWVRDALARLA